MQATLFLNQLSVPHQESSMGLVWLYMTAGVTLSVTVVVLVLLAAAAITAIVVYTYLVRKKIHKIVND
jgi:hypothetical protein